MTDLNIEEMDKGILLITLNRPNARNAITREMREEFASALEYADAESSVRVVAVTGAGQSFCVGQDLKSAAAPETEECVTRSVTDQKAALQLFHEQFSGALYDVKKPTVALVNGAAAGGGFGLCLAADFRIASDNALFVSAFSNLALPGDNGITYGLERLVGRSKALEILMLSPRIHAEEAKTLGLVRSVVPDYELLQHGLDFCRQLSDRPIHAYAQMKLNMNLVENSTYAENLDREASATALAALSAESRQAIQEFVNKRKS